MTHPDDDEELLSPEKVYAEGQGNFKVAPDAFDDEIARGHSVSSDCAECDVEHHQDDLFRCPSCKELYCESHLDEEDHNCVPAEEDKDE